MLRVLRSWKGAVPGEVFHLWWSGSAHGVRGRSMRLGRTYLVFARPPDRGDPSQVGWADGICSPTREVSHEVEGLAISNLGPPLAAPDAGD